MQKLAEMEVVPSTAYNALQEHVMLKKELRQMCKAGDAAQRLPEHQALMTFMQREACMYAEGTLTRTKSLSSGALGIDGFTTRPWQIQQMMIVYGW